MKLVNLNFFIVHFVRRVRSVEKKIMLISNAFISEKMVPEFNIDKFDINFKKRVYSLRFSTCWLVCQRIKLGDSD